MATVKEKQRQYWSVFVLYGIYQILDQWNRFTSMFLQGVHAPRHDFLRSMLILNSIGNYAILVGSFFIAHIIDSVGCKTSAMFATFFTGIYQILIPSLPNYESFAVLQLLLFANHMPMIVDAIIAQIVGENGDDKERARLITRLSIPQSLATLAPALVAQILLFLSISGCQRLCGVLSLLTLFAILILFKEDYHLSKISTAPSIRAYWDMFADPHMRWSLIFLLLVAAPYSAYDITLRTTLTYKMMARPADLAILVAAIGVSGIVATLLFLPFLQARVGPQRIVEISLAVLTFSYVYLSQVKENFHLLIGMQAQMIGVCLAFGQLSAQILGQAARGNVGKAAALNRACLVATSAVAPFLVTMPYGNLDFDHSSLCYFCATVSVVAIPVVHFFGTFMRTHFMFLPRSHET